MSEQGEWGEKPGERGTIAQSSTEALEGKLSPLKTGSSQAENLSEINAKEGFIIDVENELSERENKK